ncbi:pht4 [Symbiodinium necroappetens]|uniref:Pht4 protein n=1 Tax=Symbiodinium necroappetens TaxID=1628268 RepID=A0A813A9L2_9DINO|nr:pht4 [Symbiodinium necroappetens]
MHPSSGGLKVQLHDGSEHQVPGFYFENHDSEGDGPESLHAFIHGCLGEQFTNAADVLLRKKACTAMRCSDLLLDLLTAQISVSVSSSTTPRDCIDCSRLPAEKINTLKVCWGMTHGTVHGHDMQPKRARQ